jgi:hypothetical protein
MIYVESGFWAWRMAHGFLVDIHSCNLFLARFYHLVDMIANHSNKVLISTSVCPWSYDSLV